MGPGVTQTCTGGAGCLTSQHPAEPSLLPILPIPESRTSEGLPGTTGLHYFLGLSLVAWQIRRALTWPLGFLQQWCSVQPPLGFSQPISRGCPEASAPFLFSSWPLITFQTLFEGVWEGHVHTALFKMDHQQGPTV